MFIQGGTAIYCHAQNLSTAQVSSFTSSFKLSLCSSLSLCKFFHSFWVKQTVLDQVCLPMSFPETFITSLECFAKKQMTKPFDFFPFGHLTVPSLNLFTWSYSTGPGKGSCRPLPASQGGHGRLPMLHGFHGQEDAQSCWKSRGELVWLSGEG